MKKPYQRLSVGASVAAILGTAMLGYMPMAFSADGADELGEVTVTGSRIVRRDTEANSPLVTVDSTDLESRAGLNVESYLNQLPNFNPAASPTTTNTDVQISPVNTVGISTVSLRGFGSNRGLVLIDSHRVAPVNSMMQVDTNGIPSSMIKRVEIISGGASATYGADAIGGVTNFIMKRNFEGMEADAQYGITQAGDGQEMRFSGLVGAKLADGRGHVTFAAEYYDRSAAYLRNRSFYTDAWKDPTVAGNFLGFVFGANGYYTQTNVPNAGVLGAILDAQGRPAGLNTGVYSNPGTGNNNSIRLQTGGKIFLPAGNNAWSWNGGIDNYTYSYVNAFDSTKCNSTNTAVCTMDQGNIVQVVKYNETDQYASSPQTRYSFMGTGSYDITDRVHFNASARFAQSRTLTYLAGTNASNGWEVLVPYNATTDSPIDPSLTLTPALATQIMANPSAYANPNFIEHGKAGAQHPVTTAMALLLNSRPNSPRTSSWEFETYPWNSFDRRRTDNTLTTWQVDAGLNFDLPIKDWTAEIYFSRGETNTYDVAYGNNSLAKWRALVTAADYGYHSNLQSNLTNNGPGASPGFGSVAVPCTSGFYDTIFNSDATPSADCLYAAALALQTNTQTQQDIFEVNLQGGVFNLPAGEVRSAVGYQFRRNATQFRPDNIQSTASFNDQVIGVYPTGYMDAQTIAHDVYAEALVPVIKDFLVNKAELELGIRYSDYDQTDSTTTYKILGNIEINRSFRLRGGFNRATRAPNMGEMFLPLQQIFTGGPTYGDPCSLRTNSPFGAGGATMAPAYVQSLQDSLYNNGNGTLGSGLKDDGSYTYDYKVPGALMNQITNDAGPRAVAGQSEESANSAFLICQALMTQTGATGSSFYYSNAQANAGGGGFAWLNQIGNPNLKSETADTWTVGLVIQSPFENAWLRGITATFDWYKISINNAIMPYSAEYARFRCYGATTVSTLADAQAWISGDGAAACGFTQREGTQGGALAVQVSYDNQAVVNTSGLDFALNWRAALSDLGLEKVPGNVSLNINGTLLDYYRTKQSPAGYDPLIDWKGSAGPNLQGFNAGAYSYRLFTTLGYNLPSVGGSLRWRFLPSIVTSGIATTNAIIANNERYEKTHEGTVLSYTPSAILPVASYSMFDLSGYWNINPTLSLRAGVDNVFNIQPASNARNPGFGLGTDMAALCQDSSGNAKLGCIAPTAYSLPNSGAGATSGGFYDTLGRRYYIGLKATF